MFKKLLTIFALITAFHQLTECLNLGHGTDNLQKFAELAEALKFGDNCSWEAEEYRQNISIRFLDPDTSNSELKQEIANTVVERGYKLCSRLELLTCDKESQKCACGNAGYEALRGVNRSIYTVEENKCRWDANTYCIAKDMVSYGSSGRPLDFRCKIGTTCKLGDNICAMRSAVRNVLSKHGWRISLRQVAEEFVSGRVCSCKPDQVEEEDDDGIETDGILNSWDGAESELIRRKRSVSDAVKDTVSKLENYL